MSEVLHGNGPRDGRGVRCARLRGSPPCNAVFSGRPSLAGIRNSALQ